MDTRKDTDPGEAVKPKFGRRNFIKAAGVVVGSALLASCVPSTLIPPTEGPNTPVPPKPEDTPVPEIGYGEYDCSVEGDKNWPENQKSFIEALGKDYVPGMELAAIPFQANYYLNKGSKDSPAQATFIAIPPMNVVHSDGQVKQTEDQLWFQDPKSKKFNRLGYVVFENADKVPTGIMWVPTNKNLGLYDTGLVPEADEAEKEGDWLMLADMNGDTVMRPPQSLLVGRQGWGPSSSCRVSTQPTDVLTPTPSGSDGGGAKFSSVSEISLRSAATVTVEAPKPEKQYICPVNPDSLNMSEVSLTNDIKSGDLARWALKQPGAKRVISKNPSKLNLTVEEMGDGGPTLLSAQRIDKPGWSAMHSSVIGVCKINPREFGIEGKNNAYIIISAFQDKDDKRVAQFTIAGKKMVDRLYKGGWLTDPIDGIAPFNRSDSTLDIDLIAEGAKPGKEDDLRVLGKHETLYGAQGKTIDDVNRVFGEISEADIFTDETANFFNTTVFYTAIYRDSG
jgi:hypothetical protein